MLYWSCHNEVHTHDLVRSALNDGKRVFLPRCDPRVQQIDPYQVTDLSTDLEAGPFGILEPKGNTPRLVDLSELDVCIIPGIAFDPRGNRVGRGLGYYDRFLRKLPPRTKRIALAYVFQIVEKIYPTDGDASVHMVITENGMLVARPSVIK
jgi:5-formyltetrahydrofolate cyclo-ligase